MTAPRVVVALLLVCALGVAGCGGPVNPNLDPTRNLSREGKIAYQSARILKALDTFRDIAADGERRKVISPKTALAVLAYHKSIALTMDAAPGGWRAIALKGLDELEKNMTSGEQHELAPFTALARTLIEAFVPAVPVSRLWFTGGPVWA